MNELPHAEQQYNFSFELTKTFAAIYVLQQYLKEQFDICDKQIFLQQTITENQYQPCRNYNPVTKTTAASHHQNIGVICKTTFTTKPEKNKPTLAAKLEQPTKLKSEE